MTRNLAAASGDPPPPLATSTSPASPILLHRPGTEFQFVHTSPLICSEEMHDHISVEVTMLSEVDNLEKNPLVITR